MNEAQRAWVFQAAKQHAAVFLGREADMDDELILATAEQMEVWASLNESRGDPERKKENIRIAIMLRGVVSHFDGWSQDTIRSVLEKLKASGFSAAGHDCASDDEWAKEEASGEAHLRLFLGRWGASGLPIVKPIDVNWVAAMCATNIAPEFLLMQRVPWASFVIELPAGTGLYPGPSSVKGSDRDPDGGEVRFIAVTRVMEPVGNKVVTDDEHVNDGMETWVCVRSWCGTHRWNRPMHLTRRMSQLGDDLPHGGPDDPRYLRCQKMVSKLVGGVLMAIQSNQIRKTSSAAKKRLLRQQKLPSNLEFVVGTPVRVRMIEFLRDYIAIGPRKMKGPRTVQTLVRGHWKNQPYGPRSSLRKFIHVEPYWSGQADAPIAVRPHILSDRKDAAE